jgi:hypothetical protein
LGVKPLFGVTESLGRGILEKRGPNLAKYLLYSIFPQKDELVQHFSVICIYKTMTYGNQGID